MRFIPTHVHAVLDYLVAAVLVAAPWVLGFARNGPDTWIPVLLGVAIILYSVFTDYELGIVGGISMKVHLSLDAAGGILLVLSPWLFQFAEYIWVPHVLVGPLEIGAALTTQTRRSYSPPHEQTVEGLR